MGSYRSWLRGDCYRLDPKPDLDNANVGIYVKLFCGYVIFWRIRFYFRKSLMAMSLVGEFAKSGGLGAPLSVAIQKLL